MRTRSRKLSLIVSVIPVCGLTALLLYAQGGGDLKPLRAIRDPFPVFTDVAVDSESNIAVFSDENLFSLRTYDRNNPDAPPNAVSHPRTVINGPKYDVDYDCG